MCSADIESAAFQGAPCEGRIVAEFGSATESPEKTKSITEESNHELDCKY
jgi:hypothetical protein